MHAYRADLAFDGDRMLTDGALVLVEGRTVVGVEPARTDAPEGCPVTYRPGTTLLPGLVDAHVHLCGDAGPRALEQLGDLDDAELDAIVVRALDAQLQAGVTAVRDLGDARWTVADRHRGRPDGPTVVASGPPITTHGGHCANMGGEAEGPDALRAGVRRCADHGVDVVKVMTSGGMMTVTTDITACQYTVDDLRVVVETAHAAGLPVTAHAHATPAVEQCVAAGVDGIEHCSCITSAGFATPPELARRIATAGIVVCPTLGFAPGVEPPPHVRALLASYGVTLGDRIPQVADLHAAGVRIISGGDAGISPGKPHGVLPHSLIALASAGVSPREVLVSATSAAADVCGLGHRTGRLRPGLDADLLLVDGNPAADVTAVTRVTTVVSRGRLVREPAPMETAPHDE